MIVNPVRQATEYIISHDLKDKEWRKYSAEDIQLLFENKYKELSLSIKTKSHVALYVLINEKLKKSLNNIESLEILTKFILN